MIPSRMHRLPKYNRHIQTMQTSSFVSLDNIELKCFLFFCRELLTTIPCVIFFTHSKEYKEV